MLLIVQSLTSRRLLLSSTLLSSPRTTSALLPISRSAPNDPSTTSPSTDQAGAAQEKPPTEPLSLQSLATAQSTHDITNLYRLNGVTAFSATDPDPAYSWNEDTKEDKKRQNLLGIRFDVLSANPAERGNFGTPYYVLLASHRPENSSSTAQDDGGASDSDSSNEKSTRRSSKNRPWLQVARHTVPPVIPLKALERRYLPSPSVDAYGSYTKTRKQDLQSFVRVLRQELLSWTLRRGVFEQLKSAKAELGLTDVVAVNAEITELKLEWADGFTGKASKINRKGKGKGKDPSQSGAGIAGRIACTKDGEIKKVVFADTRGWRRRDMERVMMEVGRMERLLDGLRRIGELAVESEFRHTSDSAEVDDSEASSQDVEMDDDDGSGDGTTGEDTINEGNGSDKRERTESSIEY